MRRVHVSAAVVLGIALAALPAAGPAAGLTTGGGLRADGDCGAGAGSETITVIYEGQLVTITTDNFGTCLVSTSQSVTAPPSERAAAAPSERAAAAPSERAARAVPVAGQPALTG